MAEEKINTPEGAIKVNLKTGRKPKNRKKIQFLYLRA